MTLFKAINKYLQGNEAMRAQLFRLRSTWKTDHFIKSKLFAIDTKINEIDKAWPIASTSTTRPNTTDENATIKTSTSGNMVHVNPKFFNKNNDHEATNTTDEGSHSLAPKRRKMEPTAPPQMQSFPSQTAVVPQLHNQQFPSVQIRDETPRIGLPENKRIFLDGKAYEVNFNTCFFNQI